MNTNTITIIGKIVTVLVTNAVETSDEVRPHTNSWYGGDFTYAIPSVIYQRPSPPTWKTTTSTVEEVKTLEYELGGHIGREELSRKYLFSFSKTTRLFQEWRDEEPKVWTNAPAQVNYTNWNQFVTNGKLVFLHDKGSLLKTNGLDRSVTLELGGSYTNELHCRIIGDPEAMEKYKGTNIFIGKWEHVKPHRGCYLESK